MITWTALSAIALNTDIQTLCTREEFERRYRAESRCSMNTKLPLREELRQAVLQRILRGVLPPGSRIIESKLSEELGVSRTPLREALLHLEQQGFVRSDLARGFSVEPLSQQEVREIYPIIWTLEGLALRSIGPLLKATLPRHPMA